MKTDIGKKYSLGFIFNAAGNRVVLMRKLRPEWQKGKLNGVGGKVESGETPIVCIVREAEEECGLKSGEKDWRHVAQFLGSDWEMDVFGLFFTDSEENIRSLTDESVAWYDTATLPSDTLSNVPWLVALALDRMHNDQIETCVVHYK